MKNRKRILAAVFCLPLVSSMTGCGAGMKYKGGAVYKPLIAPRSNLGPYTLAVLPAEDKRGHKNDREGKMSVPMIPIVPRMTMTRERPEIRVEGIASNRRRMGYPDNFSVSNFIQQALVKEMENSRMFQRVVPVRDIREAQQADLILKPTVFSTKTRTWATAYILGIYWLYMTPFIPLPTSGSYHELSMTLELFEPGSARPLWAGKVQEKGKGKAHIYYLTGTSKYYGNGVAQAMVLAPGPADHEGQPLNELVAQGMAKETPVIYNFLKRQSPTFWEEIQAKKQAPPEAPAGEAPGEKPATGSFEQMMQRIQKELLEEE